VGDDIDHPNAVVVTTIRGLIFLVQGKTVRLSMSNAQRSSFNPQLRKSICWPIGVVTAVIVTFGLMATASAQFTPALLQNDSYWGGGKAEFDFYDAQIMREGAPRHCEVLHILVREPFDPKQLVKADDWRRPGLVNVIKLNQVLHVPIGVYVCQQMHSSFWRTGDGALLKWSLTSNDSCGNTFKEARRLGDQFAYDFHTYWDGMADGHENVPVPANAFFYDELPLRVRTIDFSKPNGEFDIQLAPTTINSKKDRIAFKPAKVSFQSGDRTIEVDVRHDAGTDHFVLDRDFPFLLREWQMADGSHLKLKNSLKIDYWNYNKPGDRERALNNPMLRHPD
jgi:hypothetical protein